MRIDTDNLQDEIITSARPPRSPLSSSPLCVPLAATSHDSGRQARALRAGPLAWPIAVARRCYGYAYDETCPDEPGVGDFFVRNTCTPL